MSFVQGLAYPFRPGPHQRVKFTIPSGLQGSAGFHVIWPRLTLKQAVRLCGAQGKLSAAGQAVLPGALDEDFLDSNGDPWGKHLADAGLGLVELSNRSGTWTEETGGDDLARVIWYGDWFPSGKTAIDIREELQTSYAADELAFLRSALTDTEIDALLWDTPQSTAGGSYAPSVVCSITRANIHTNRTKPTAPTIGNEPTPGTDLANGTTGSEDEVSSVSYLFAAGDVGKAVIIGGGTGWTTGTYNISSVNTDSGSITAFADAGGGQVTVTSASHGIPEGRAVTISGTTSYNDTFTATNVAENTFEITATFVADDATGSWATGVAVLDSAPAAADATGGEWVMQDFDYVGEGIVMAAEGGGGEGTIISWRGVFPNHLAPLGSAWASALTDLGGGLTSQLRFRDGSRDFTRVIVGLTTPTKEVLTYYDGDLNDPGQQSAGLWMENWQNEHVLADAAAADDWDAAGSKFKRWLDGLTGAGGDPAYVQWDVKNNSITGAAFPGFSPYQFEAGEVSTKNPGALVGGLGHVKQIESLADDGSGGTIVTLAGDRIPHIDADIGITGEQDEHTFTFSGVTGTPDLNGTHKIAFDATGEANAVNATTFVVPGIAFVADGTGECWGTHAPMNADRTGFSEAWPMMGGVDIEAVFGSQLDSFDIKRGAAGSWQEHTGTPEGAVIANWRGDERTAMLAGIGMDYWIEKFGSLMELVASEIPNSVNFAFRYHQQASAIFPSANGFLLQGFPFSSKPKLQGVRPIVVNWPQGVQNYWSRKTKQLRFATYAGTDADDWNMLLYGMSQIHAAAAATNVPNVFWFRNDSSITAADKYYQWFIRLVWLTGWQPFMAIESIGTNQADIDMMRVGSNDAETQIGSNNFAGWVLGDPHHDDLYDQKIIRICRDVGGQFLNAVLVRPDEYDGGNFVDDGSGGVDVVDALGTTVLLNIPNAAIGDVVEPAGGPGAWIPQTQL